VCGRIARWRARRIDYKASAISNELMVRLSILPFAPVNNLWFCVSHYYPVQVQATHFDPRGNGCGIVKAALLARKPSGWASFKRF